MKKRNLVSKDRKEQNLEDGTQNYTLHRKIGCNSNYSLEGYKINHKINGKRNYWKYYLSSDQEKSRWNPRVQCLHSGLGRIPAYLLKKSPIYTKVKPADPSC